MASIVYVTPEVPTDLKYLTLISFISSYSKLWGIRRAQDAIVFLMII